MIKRFKKRIIPDWKKSWRWFSVQAMVLSGCAQLTWAALPEDLKQAIPKKLCTVVSISLLGFGIIGRLVDQPVKPKAIEEKEEGEDANNV